MSNTFLHYIIGETLFESLNSIVVRALNKNDNTTVIIKFPRDESVKTRTKYTKEFESAKTINSKYVLKYLGTVKYQSGVALILEDFGAISIMDFLSANKVRLKYINSQTNRYALKDRG